MSRVWLLDVPVGLFCASEQHTDDVLREVALIAAARPDSGRGHLFGDLIAAADRYAHRPAAVHRQVADRVLAAYHDGRGSVDVRVEADAGIAASTLEWAALLARFDEMSRADELLVLPAPPDVAAFRTWYATEIAEQASTGRTPLRWAGLATLAGAAS